MSILGTHCVSFLIVMYASRLLGHANGTVSIFYIKNCLSSKGKKNKKNKIRDTIKPQTKKTTVTVGSK